jgi:disulfide bond formation protein DsbB
VLAWLACLVALATAAGSVYLSVGMELEACPLCFYQRTFAFAAFGVLLVGLLAGAPRSGLCLMTLPLAVGGLGVAAFHVYLEWNGTLECPKGVFDVGTAPQQSLAGMALLTALLVLGTLSGGQQRGGALAAVGGTVLLGVLFAVGSVFSAPPLPKAPSAPYDQPLKRCRPPYVRT